MGISILPDFVTKQERNFVRRPLAPALKVDICLFWGNNKRITEMDQKFLDFMKRYIASDEFQHNF